MQRRPTSPYECDHLAICEVLLDDDTPLQERETFLDQVLWTENGKSRLFAASERLEIHQKAYESAIHPARVLIKRALSDIQTALACMKPTVESLCHYLANPARTTQSKDRYLVHLMETTTGCELIDKTIPFVVAEVARITKEAGRARWDGNDEEASKQTYTLNIAKAALALLNDAKSSQHPTPKNIYDYLTNTNRSQEAKIRYLTALKKEDNGPNLLNLTDNYVKLKLQHAGKAHQWLSRLNTPTFLKQAQDDITAIKNINHLLRSFTADNSNVVIRHTAKKR